MFQRLIQSSEIVDESGQYFPYVSCGRNVQSSLQLDRGLLRILKKCDGEIINLEYLTHFLHVLSACSISSR